MPRGPLPDPKHRHREAPAIPTTSLPVGGRKGDPPTRPAHVELAAAGEAWWLWAWATPQAAAWSAGDLYVVARRAALEDDLATIAQVDNLDALGLVDEDDEIESIRTVRAIISRLAALCSGRLAIMKEMRELDTRLGLTPKGRSDLRWEIVDVDHSEDADDDQDLGALTVKELRAVARDRKIHVAAGMRKADILGLLEGAPVADIADARRRRLTANAP